MQDDDVLLNCSRNFEIEDGTVGGKNDEDGFGGGGGGVCPLPIENVPFRCFFLDLAIAMAKTLREPGDRVRWLSAPPGKERRCMFPDGDLSPPTISAVGWSWSPRSSSPSSWSGWALLILRRGIVGFLSLKSISRSDDAGDANKLRLDKV